MQNKKKASTLIYMIFFYVAFLFFTAMAIDGTIILTNRAKLQDITEAAALTAASEFNYNSNATPANIEAVVTQSATDTFKLLKTGRLNEADVSVKIDTNKKHVLLESQMLARPYFLAFFGVTGIRLEAKSCAKSAALPVLTNYNKINWINAQGTYTTDIIPADSNIKSPLGMENTFSKSYIFDPNTSLNIPNYGLIENGGLPLNLGAGGYITVKLPSPIIDKPGFDLVISELGNAIEGYMVFAGIDEDNTTPYIHLMNQAPVGNIKWVNISCSGTSEELGASAHGNVTTAIGIQPFIFGSAKFDLSHSCLASNQLSMVRYLRIVDDNQEAAYIKQNGPYKLMNNLYGESSSSTPGADIDNIVVLNVVSIMPAANYGI